MAPTKGSFHRRARRDSGAARIWAWARAKRGPWTSAEAADECAVSARRCRAILKAMSEAGILDQQKESEVSAGGQQAAEWALSADGRALSAAPVMIVDGRTGLITGVRAA